jgi:catechol 2,3-dioxygenase-like lactoylglutathione lyase family enzyme
VLLGARLKEGTPMLKWPTWIGVVCEDLESQRKFYRDTLGLNEVRAEEGFVWFEFENEVFELLAKSSKPQYDRRRVSFGFEVDDIQRVREELLARGVEPVTGIEGGREARQYWAYFKDAEGNLFEVVQRIG